MKIRSEKIKDDIDANWKSGNLKSSQQKDGHSCGLFILMVNITMIWFTHADKFLLGASLLVFCVEYGTMKQRMPQQKSVYNRFDILT